MTEKPLQEHVLPFGRTCYGCGSENPRGLRLQSFREGEEIVATWQPQPHHVSGPGVISGGGLATLMDCHTCAAATEAGYRAEGRAMGEPPLLTYVTASLHVNYLRPTPLAGPLTLRAHVTAMEGRRVVVACTLWAEGEETANAEAVYVRVGNAPAGR